MMKSEYITTITLLLAFVSLTRVPAASENKKSKCEKALTCRQCVHKAWPGCIDKAWNITKEGTCVEGDSCVTWAVINTENGEVNHMVRECLVRYQTLHGTDQPPNTCYSDGYKWKRCIHTCDNEDYCNENMTWAPPGWDIKGRPVDLNSTSLNSSTFRIKPEDIATKEPIIGEDGSFITTTQYTDLEDYNDAGSWHSIAKGTTEKGLEAHPSLHGSDQNSATKFESSMSVLLLIFIIINADWPVFY